MSIPASQIVQVNPGVLNAGGSALSLNGVMLTNDPSIPIGTVQSFPTAAAVSTWFGPNSTEAALAAVYFAGRNNATVIPASLLFSQYASADVPAYLRGGALAGVPLSVLQSLTGTLTVTVDGVSHTSSSINLSSATSYSNAASLMQAAFTGLGATITYDSVRNAFVVTSNTTGTGVSFTGSIAGTTLTVTGTPVGKLQVGQTISGVGVTAGTTITALLTGTGGAGTYTVSATQTVTSEAMTASGSSVSFATGTLASGVQLTQATGAVQSIGAVADTPATGMARVVAATLNWATFMTVFEPVTADKLGFSSWTNGQNNLYAYVGWDTDVTITGSAPPTTSWMYQCIAAGYSGSFGVYKDPKHAAFVLGCTASLDVNRLNGRITYAFKYLSGLIPSVTDATIAANLQANGYNFIGAYATANQNFTFLYPGQISGPYGNMTRFVNQIYLNSQLQLAAINLLTQVNSIPYNSQGSALIASAFNDPINQALNFGTIRTGISLSSAQAALVNAAAGVAIDSVLSSRGWYLQILPATPQVRAAGGSPPCTLWYMDGGDVLKIVLASIVIQ